MKPEVYEAYVTELVKQLDFAQNGSVYRNRKYPGVRQPGEYEIDVAVETELGDKMDFLLIVECKNWKRPVDRPVVQKLAQTRDAIAAHKAAIASPVGFTKEAVIVAKTLGIALWVMSKANWQVIMGLRGPPPWLCRLYCDRMAVLDHYNLLPSESACTGEYTLIDFLSASSIGSPGDTLSRFTHKCVGGSAVPPGSGIPGFDKRTAVYQILNKCLRLLGHKQWLWRLKKLIRQR